MLRGAVTERAVLWRDATDGAAQVLYRDCGEKPGNSACEKVHNRVDGVIAELTDEPRLPVVQQRRLEHRG